MDQLKDILRQAIKYRFWIAVGISALLPVIAYAVGSGPIKDEAAKKTQEIKGADTEVQKYTGGDIPNAQYKPLVDKEKEVLSHDVQVSHQKLYERQAPLLTWPKNVEDRFRSWGPKWPENVNPTDVQLAIIDYVTAYPKFVTQVYETFHPFNMIEGTGVVAAPQEFDLLKPAQFTVEQPPPLGKVWAAQEKLWVQRTLLQTVADVNRDAKDWSAAIIKQINLLDVGTATAQDQLSMAKGEQLEPSQAMAPPGAPAAPAAPADPNAPPPDASAAPGMAGGPTSNDPNEVYFIKTPTPQYKVLPFQMSVLIEQDHVQDFLVALENSPMAIQVVDFELSKPTAPVVKPEKGENFMNYGYGDPMMMGRNRMPGAPGLVPFGMRPMIIGGGPQGQRLRGTGTDVRGTDRKSKREMEEALIKQQSAAVTIHDPYYYIVNVTIYGQARFYNAPPPEPAPAPSQAEGTPAEAAPATPPAEAPAPQAPEAKPEAPAAKEETPKAEAPAPKAEAPAAKEEAAPKAESPATPPAATPPAATEGAAPKS
jgi:hypothetical protein